MKAKVFLLSIALFLAGSQTARGQKVVDVIIALVNNQVITRSDLLWSLALDPKAPDPAGPVGSEVLKLKLDVMVDERLISQEANRVPGAPVSREEIEAKRSELIKAFKSEVLFRERVQSVGLTQERIDELLRQRVLIDRFIDFRFRSFVFISEQEIRRQYDTVVVPKIREQGQVAPALEQVRDQILQVMKEEKTYAEIDKWLAQARRSADIVVLSEP